MSVDSNVPGDADRLRLISWNVHGLPVVSAEPSVRMQRIARKIAEEEPDLVLLQEVWVTAYRRQIGEALGEDYGPVFAPRRVSGWPRGGLVAFVRRSSGWRVSRPAAFETFEHRAPWWRLGEGDGLSGKGCLALHLEHRVRRLVAVNTHLQAQYPERDRFYERERQGQLEGLERYLSSALADHPMLVAGDFNTMPSEPLYESHLSRLGFDLTHAERSRSGGATSIGEQTPADHWIDYAFARDLEPSSARVELFANTRVDHPFSDHHGLLVQLDF